MNPAFDPEEYYAMFDKVRDGIITHEAWVDYCMTLLDILLEEPEIKDVMIRLKNR